MATVNEVLADEAIRHAVYLQRYSNAVVRRMLSLLNAADADLTGQIAAALADMDAGAFTVERLEQLLASARRINADAYQRVQRELSVEMRRLTEYEAGYQNALFTETLPAPVLANVTVATVSVEQVYAAALARPFQGKLLAPWQQSVVAEIGEARMTRIRDALRMGYVENESVGQMVRRIRGTKAAGYADGLLEVDRRHAEAVVRTATQHFAAVARDHVYEANADLIETVRWVSTLDARTSEMCRIRDGLRYENTDAHKPIGHKVPWGAGPGRLHWNCRSTASPVIKLWRDLGIESDQLSAGTRASMDGQVPAETTYADWIKRQPAARQDDILGATRGRLMRQGKLDLDRFYNERGRYLTLDELRERDAAAFKRAGL